MRSPAPAAEIKIQLVQRTGHMSIEMTASFRNEGVSMTF